MTIAPLALDVAVVGAGQAGLVTGYFLKPDGLDVRLFDPARQHRRALIHQHRARARGRR